MLTFGRSREPRQRQNLKRGSVLGGRLRRAVNWLAIHGLLGRERQCSFHREVSAVFKEDPARALDMWCSKCPFYPEGFWQRPPEDQEYRC